MSELSVNLGNLKQPQADQQLETVETGGVIAKATNTPSPLFNAVPSVETGGSIASSSSSSAGGSSSGGGTSFVC